MACNRCCGHSRYAEAPHRRGCKTACGRRLTCTLMRRAVLLLYACVGLFQGFHRIAEGFGLLRGPHFAIAMVVVSSEGRNRVHKVVKPLLEVGTLFEY